MSSKKENKAQIVMDKSAIIAQVKRFAQKASRCHAAAFDVVIINGYLQWEHHYHNAVEEPIICTYQTLEVLQGSDLFQTAQNLAKIQSAIADFNKQ